MLRAVLTIAGGAVLLLWAAALNGYPFLFWDNTPYIQQGHQAAAAASALVRGQPVEPIDYMSSRSLAYGAYLFLGFKALTFWGVAVLQALAVAWLVWLAMRDHLQRGADPSPANYFALVGLLAFASSAPFSAAYMMPDAWTAPGILIAALWLFRPEGRPIWPYAVALGLWVFSLMIHTSHLMLGAMVTAVSIPLLRWSGLDWRSVVNRSGVAAGALIASMAANGAMHATMGSDLKSAPFLSARLLADGQATDYLESACQKSPDAYVLCRYRDGDFSDANMTLWTPQVFGAIERADWIRMTDEDISFAWGAFLHRPFDVAISSIANGLRQSATFRVGTDFGPIDYLNERFSPMGEWTDPIAENLSVSRTARGTFPFALVDALIAIGLLASLGFIAASAFATLHPAVISNLGQADRLVLSFVAVLVLAVFANAMILGSMSGVWERYQARIVWLVPLAAGLMALRFGLPFRRPAVAAP